MCCACGGGSTGGGDDGSADDGEVDYATCASDAADDAGIAMQEAGPHALSDVELESFPVPMTITGSTELEWLSSYVTETPEEGVYNYMAAFYAYPTLLADVSLFGIECEIEVSGLLELYGTIDVTDGAAYSAELMYTIDSTEDDCGGLLESTGLTFSEITDMDTMFNPVADNYAEALAAAFAPECLTDDGGSD
jgi:hypothetical protein